MDMSNKLYDYLESIKYGELDVLSSKRSDVSSLIHLFTWFALSTLKPMTTCSHC